ncbi:MAG: hypothetical protein GTN84_08235 [Hydrogenophaga sp.]|uniref:hypothetical protein n=1 Tax=Hydrogenophaga sp. TaxID=1904254 RepID=UPI0016B7C24D|nr:hypothetical protein [Hydrogenophaga sp.]NIN58492.1 hypothetical protein [Xanthomonadales bacterium]NIN55316.1 hypothetical protein [Hydrogenophaga sp.]NIO13776.1 hypothetical protein [Xanthomonadales bacterium]NIO51621.1 hypothetical protein [Hydrogenophaga sp.]NIP10885.1 hypothetical protein [Xanthomonadales bacterium]
MTSPNMAHGAPSPGARPAPERQQSRLLPAVFARLKPAPRLRVLEVGLALPETVAFFSQWPCRLRFADLYSEALVRDQQNDLSQKKMQREFTELLGFPVGSMLDLVLFWDFLNYLNRPALRAFSAALQPYVHPGTRAHGFSVLNVQTPLRNQKYSIEQPDTVLVRPAGRKQLHYYPHSHEELNESMSCFDIERGWLLPDGRLEILLAATV